MSHARCAHQYSPSGKHPGDLIDDIGDKVTGAAQDLVHTIGSGVKGAGEGVQQALDKPAQALKLRHSPFRMVDDPLKAVITVVENGAVGVIDAGRIVADSITDGLDRIPDTFLPAGGRELIRGFPPKPLSDLLIGRR